MRSSPGPGANRLRRELNDTVRPGRLWILSIPVRSFQERRLPPSFIMFSIESRPRRSGPNKETTMTLIPTLTAVLSRTRGAPSGHTGGNGFLRHDDALMAGGTASADA